MHIDVMYNWIQDALDAKLLEVVKIHTNDNGAHMMAKALPRGKFRVCCEIAGLASYLQKFMKGKFFGFGLLFYMEKRPNMVTHYVSLNLVERGQIRVRSEIH